MLTEFVHNPHILEEIQKDLDRVHVGDNNTKVLIVLLLASSKRRGHEQAIIIQKQSSAGGSHLQNSCLAYYDNKFVLTRMTQAFVDRNANSYNGMILAIGEMSGFDSGSPALRQQLSEGQSNLGTTDRDQNGRIVTNIITTNGRPTFITTTTSPEIHEEFINRCWIISVDESPDQTKAIIRYQFGKDTFEHEEWIPNPEIKSLLNSDKLEDYKIINPFSKILGEQFPSGRLEARRDSRKFAELVSTITFLFQYQRIRIRRGSENVLLTSFEDLKNAFHYSQETLENTLSKIDSKSKSILHYMQSQQGKEITRQELIKALDIPYATIKRHLRGLVNKSYLEENQGEDKIWKYRFARVPTNEFSFISEQEYEKALIDYIKTNLQKIDEVILPPNYVAMIEMDMKLVEFFRASGKVITTENGNTLGVKSMPISTLPSPQIRRINFS